MLEKKDGKLIELFHSMNSIRQRFHCHDSKVTSKHGSIEGDSFKLKKHGRRKENVDYWLRAQRADDVIDSSIKLRSDDDVVVIVDKKRLRREVKIGKYKSEDTLEHRKNTFLKNWSEVRLTKELGQFKREMAVNKVSVTTELYIRFSDH